jgi:5-(carboxyamino)imidazole ribonucleotide synthase
MMPDPGSIRPGATLGILGGGQLGRMLAVAAAQLGLRVHVYSPDADSPAFDVAGERTLAAYEDEAALMRFAQTVDVVTYEFENVPGRTAEILSTQAPLAPNARALAITQDRLEEKTFVAGLGIPTAPFAAAGSEEQLQEALRTIGQPSVLKTRRFGYDGKGQVMLRPGIDPGAAWSDLGANPCILEGFVPFEREVSVVAARSASGDFAAYDLCANEHRSHILDVTRVPAGVAAGPSRER